MTSSGRTVVDVGSVIADTYTIEGLIGRGGMGAVFVASHNRLPGKKVAIKVLHAELHDEELLVRFRREAQIASMLGHPNIVGVHDFNVTPDGMPYLVLDYLEGETLAHKLQRGPLAVEQVQAVVRQVGSALAAAHREGIVHRDLKPQNIFLVATEVDAAHVELAKVLDFGISKWRGSQTVKTQESALLGTPQYMAPEQATGKHDSVDARTDIFALGAIVYEMLTGKPAFSGASIPEVVFKVVYEEPAPLPDTVPPAIAAAVKQAMAKAADARFADVSDFVEGITGHALTKLRGPIGSTPGGGPSSERIAAGSARITDREALARTMGSGDHASSFPSGTQPGSAPGVSLAETIGASAAAPLVDVSAPTIDSQRGNIAPVPAPAPAPSAPVAATITGVGPTTAASDAPASPAISSTLASPATTSSSPAITSSSTATASTATASTATASTATASTATASTATASTATTTTATASTATASTATATASSNAVPAKRGSRRLAVALLACVVLGGGIAAFALRGGSNKPTSVASNQATTNTVGANSTGATTAGTNATGTNATGTANTATTSGTNDRGSTTAASNAASATAAINAGGVHTATNGATASTGNANTGNVNSASAQNSGTANTSAQNSGTANTASAPNSANPNTASAQNSGTANTGNPNASGANANGTNATGNANTASALNSANPNTASALNSGTANTGNPNASGANATGANANGTNANGAAKTSGRGVSTSNTGKAGKADKTGNTTSGSAKQQVPTEPSTGAELTPREIAAKLDEAEAASAAGNIDKALQLTSFALDHGGPRQEVRAHVIRAWIYCQKRIDQERLNTELRQLGARAPRNLLEACAP